MPQVFLALQCFSCSTFQVHQEKKAKKWKCKICGESQSVRKIFCKGQAKLCRERVQCLNAARGETDVLRESITYSHADQEEALHYSEPNSIDSYSPLNSAPPVVAPARSKWTFFHESSVHEVDPGLFHDNEEDHHLNSNSNGDLGTDIMVTTDVMEFTRLTAELRSRSRRANRRPKRHNSTQPTNSDMHKKASGLCVSRTITASDSDNSNDCHNTKCRESALMPHRFAENVSDHAKHTEFEVLAEKDRSDLESTAVYTDKSGLTLNRASSNMNNKNGRARNRDHMGSSHLSKRSKWDIFFNSSKLQTGDDSSDNNDDSLYDLA